MHQWDMHGMDSFYTSKGKVTKREGDRLKNFRKEKYEFETSQLYTCAVNKQGTELL
jgi:hypothetical protein